MRRKKMLGVKKRGGGVGGGGGGSLDVYLSGENNLAILVSLFSVHYNSNQVLPVLLRSTV